MIRRLLSFAALALLLVGPPLVLVAWGQRWDGAPLTGPADVRLMLLILTVVGWLAWVAWCVAVTVELVGVLTGRPRVRLPGLGLLCGVAASLLATAIAVTTTPLAASAPTSSAPDRSPGPAVAGTSAAEPAASEEAGPADALVAGLPTGRGGGTTVPHRVVATDDLWSLAEHYYGTGTEWRRIVEANPSLQADPLAPLPEGTTLDIVDPVRLVTVVAGDSLSRLAQRHLGDDARWPEIHRLNRDAIADPDMIDIGWVLRVPWVVDTASDAAAGGPTAPVGVLVEPTAPATETSDVTDTGDLGALPDATADGDDGAGQGDATDHGAAQGTAVTDAGGEDAAAEAGEAVAEPREGSLPGVTPADAVANLRETADLVASSPEPADADATLTVAPQESGTDGTAVVGLVGGLSSVTAAAVLGGIAARRRMQELARPVGRRYASPAPELTRFETALGLTQA